MRWSLTLSGVILALLLLPLLVLADSTVVVTILDNKITVAEEASFHVAITNNDAVSRTYTLYGLEVVWSIDPEQRKFTLMPGQSRTTLVRVRPLGPFQPSTYSLKLYIDVSEVDSNIPLTRYSRDLPVVIFPQGPIEYLPALSVTIDMDDRINPQEPVSIKLILVNRNPLDLTGLMIKIQSEMPEFVKEATVDVLPLDRKTVEFSVVPNPHQQPKGYTLFFVFERGGETVKVVEKKIEILALALSFEQEFSEETVFLNKKVQIRVQNPGNVRNTQTVSVPLSWWASLFVGGDGEVQTVDGKRMVVWELSLGANESSMLSYTIHYRLPLYLAVVIILFGIFYISVRSPVRLKKSATTVKGSEEGTLAEVKVIIEVQNIAHRHLKDVAITDIVPGIANVEKSLELGTLKPHDIKHTAKGTKVIWSLAELEPQEHRVITYKIRAKLNILGSFSLPRATLEYGHGRRRRKAYSNIFRVDS